MGAKMSDWNSIEYNRVSKVQFKSGYSLWHKMLQYYSLKPDSILLDVGCGNGNYILNELKTNKHIAYMYGLDVSEDMINVAKQHAEREGLSNIKFICQDIAILNENLINQCDIAYSNCCLHWVPNKTDAMNNIMHYLKPNGIFALRTGQAGLVRLVFHLMMKEDRIWQELGLLSKYVNNNVINYDPLNYDVSYYREYFAQRNITINELDLNSNVFDFANEAEMRGFIQYGLLAIKIPDHLGEKFVDSFLRLYNTITASSKYQIHIVYLDIIGSLR